MTKDELQILADQVYPRETKAIYEVPIRRVKELQNEAFMKGYEYAIESIKYIPSIEDKKD